MMPYREFLGADGRTWIAWLADPARHAEEWAAIRDGEIPEPWLCFSGGRRVHRLQPVPPNWSELDDQALRELWRLALEAPVTAGARADALRRYPWEAHAEA
jgi:hypothetical protein